jgi:hypothetical protein
MSDGPAPAPALSAAGERRTPLARVQELLHNRWVGLSVVAVAVAFGGYAVAGQWGQIRSELAALGVLTTVGALLIVLVGLVCTMQVWRAYLAALGSPLSATVAARIFFVGQLTKYVPGSIWPVLVQMELAHAARVPRSRTATTAVLTIVTSVCAGLIAAAATLPFLPAGATAGFRWTFLLVPVFLAILHPRVINRTIGWLLRLTGRPPLERPLRGRAVAVAVGWALLSWVVLGAQVWLLATRLGAPLGTGVLLAVGGFAFAWCAGFLALLAPAGAGVRDVLLFAILTAELSPAAATTVALLSRVLLTVGDLFLAGLFAWRRPSSIPPSEVRVPDESGLSGPPGEPASR